MVCRGFPQQACIEVSATGNGRTLREKKKHVETADWSTRSRHGNRFVIYAEWAIFSIDLARWDLYWKLHNHS